MELESKRFKKPVWACVRKLTIITNVRLQSTQTCTLPSWNLTMHCEVLSSFSFVSFFDSYTTEDSTDVCASTVLTNGNW